MIPAEDAPAPAPTPPPVSDASSLPEGAVNVQPSKPRRRWPAYAAIAAAVVVVLIVVLVAVVPALKVGPASSGSSPLSYSKARPIADNLMAGFPGGGWTALVGAGLDTPEPVLTNVTSSQSVGSNCSYQLQSGVGPTISVPAFTGNLSSGVAPVWEFIYRNSSGGVAVVSVIDAQPTVLATLSGSGCGGVFGLFAPIPGQVIDSSTAAAAVAGAARPFLQAHSNVAAGFGLVGGISFLGLTSGPKWAVDYTTCAVGSSASGVGTEFNATVDALTGQLIFDQTTPGVTCTGGI